MCIITRCQIQWAAVQSNWRFAKLEQSRESSAQHSPSVLDSGKYLLSWKRSSVAVPNKYRGDMNTRVVQFCIQIHMKWAKLRCLLEFEYWIIRNRTFLFLNTKLVKYSKVWYSIGTVYLNIKRIQYGQLLLLAIWIQIMLCTDWSVVYNLINLTWLSD